MFERYTEYARRSIFFARFEASQFGSTEISSAELLLGILREDQAVAAQLGLEGVAAIRREIEAVAPKTQKVATSVDLPLSHESKMALAYAAEESEKLNQELIGTPHLVLGLLRVKGSLAAKLLGKHGIAFDQYREIARQSAPERTARQPLAGFQQPQPAPVSPPETSLEPALYNLGRLLDDTAARLRRQVDPFGGQRISGKQWTPKEALGHLIDCAIAHQRWATRAMMDGRLNAAGYPDADLAAVQHYADFPWPETVDLWASLNRLLIHVLERVPEDKLGVACRIGSAEPVPLAKLMEAYVEHCEGMVAQILVRPDWSGNTAKFERFTEHARRAISYASREARGLGSPRIDTVHLLLGILHEDQTIAGAGAPDTIRKNLEEVAPPKEKRVSVAGDLPLSKVAGKAISLAQKEADALRHGQVETAHLVLALLRIEDCTAAKLLRAYGMDYGRYRETLRSKPLETPTAVRASERPIERVSPWSETPSVPPAAARLEPSIRALESLLDGTVAHLHAYSISYGEQRLKRVPQREKPWMRQEAFGHLIDWAMAHQQWFERALAESKLTADGYPGEAEVALERYADYSWWETVDLWVMLNWVLVHMLRRIPAGQLDVPCRIGIAHPVPLAGLVSGYVEHCEDMVGQILAHL